MGEWEALEPEVRRAAALLGERFGPPVLGIVLGSGFDPLAEALDARGDLPFNEVPGLLVANTDGHRGTVAVAPGDAGSIWIFRGRLHLHEGHSVARVVLPVRILAEAGARGVLLTCAAGGLDPEERPGDLVLVEDHLNLTGEDPTRTIDPARRTPRFLDLQGVYDEALLRAWEETASAHEPRLPRRVLAAVRGPSYETPAEVRMLRALGAGIVSMSTVPEAIAARYLGLRVSAIACVSNAAAGAGGPIRHEEVAATVDGAVRARRTFVAGLVRENVRHAVGAIVPPP